MTQRAAEVLQLIGEGLPNADIAEKLYLSVRTVESHVASLLSKLGTDKRSALISLCRSEGGKGLALTEAFP